MHQESMAEQPRPLRDAEELCDRAEIEAEALQVIAMHEFLPDAGVQERERRDNARTALFEGLTASGHLSRIEISGDNPEEIFNQIMCRLINGYKNCSDPHERKRNFAEICNFLVIRRTLRLVADGELDESTAIAEISDYPLGLSDARAGNLGYRPLNRKGMARSTHLRCNADSSFTYIIEQMSRSNGTPDSTYAFLSDAGINLLGYEAPDIAVLSKPLIYRTENDYADGVVAIQRRLDECAGADIHYGEVRDANSLHVPYEQVRAESARREDEVEYYVDCLAAFEERLECAESDGLITNAQRRTQFKIELLQILRSICTLAPEYAKDCFGEAAATYYYAASDLVASGDYRGAEIVVEQASDVEQDIFLCGMKVSAETAKKLGVEPDSVAGLAKAGKENWKKKRGICRISKCPSPKPTELGPCRVCMESCQPLFDARKNPELEYAKAALRASREKNRADEGRNRVIESVARFALMA